MTQIPKAGAETTRLHLVYDAWNRLAAANADSGGSPGTTIATYSYDGEDRRIKKAINGGDTFEYYYNAGYQLLEVRKNADTDPLEQYVWDVSYIDAPLIWFRDSNVDGTVDDTFYPTRDANFNVTALIDTSGTVQERYCYDPYGRRTILEGSWGARGSSSYDWTLGHQGLMLDTETGLYYNRARMLHATLGEFVQRDPREYLDGLNLYAYVRGRPLILVDPEGTAGLPGLGLGAGIGFAVGCGGALFGDKSGCQRLRDCVCNGVAGAIYGAVLAATPGLNNAAFIGCLAGAITSELSTLCRSVVRCDADCPLYVPYKDPCEHLIKMAGALVTGCINAYARAYGGAAEWIEKTLISVVATLFNLNCKRTAVFKFQPCPTCRTRHW